MKTYRIAVIAGDGVGPEVIAEAVKVLKTAAEIDGRFAFSFTDFPWGCGYYLKTGKMMPDNGLEILKDFDAILAADSTSISICAPYACSKARHAP